MKTNNPTKDDFYRVLLDNGEITLGYYSVKEGWDCASVGHVVFWCEQKKPWEEVKEDD